MIGQTVGKYRIVAEIAEGGMGMVYRAEHTMLGSPAAVKVLLPQFTVDPQVVERFFTEAKATSAIRHVGIVEVFDFGMLDGGQAFIAMELMRGESLGDHLDRRGNMQTAMAVNVAAQMLGALDAAHVVGVIHRDIKPDNIFLIPDPGAPGGVRVKILDFGIAKLANDTLAPRRKTNPGTILGTPAYMAPEQCRGGVEIDHRADLYAVGCILFEMLTGHQPFEAAGGGETMAMHIYQPAPRLRDIQPDIPLDLDQLVAKFLTKSPADRPPSAAWALAAIERISLPPLAPTPGSGMFVAGDYAGTATGPHRAGPDPRAYAVVALPGGGAVARGTPPPVMPTMGIDSMSTHRWLPVLLVGIALLIAIGAVVVIGRSGDDLPIQPAPPTAPVKPTITPIAPDPPAPEPVGSGSGSPQ